MAYWKGSDVLKVAEKAKDLGTLLEKAPYNFTVTTHEIDDRSLSQNKIGNSFRDALRVVDDRLSAQDEETSSLLIQCYGGLGVVDQANRLWKHLIWSNYQRRM